MTKKERLLQLLDEYLPVPETVSIPNRSYKMGKYPVTFEEYDAFCEMTGREKPDDRGWGRSRRPVINVSWYDAKAYVTWLSETAGEKYRLPTEDEWEHACRAETTTRYSWGDKDPTPDQANFGCVVNKTTEVGTYPPNPWGLYDMHGNVWEWCEDGISDIQVLRGGSWINYPEVLRSAFRDFGLAGYRIDFRGFRVVKEEKSDLYRALRGGSWLNLPRFLRSAYRGIWYADDRDFTGGFRVVLEK